MKKVLFLWPLLLLGCTTIVKPYNIMDLPDKNIILTFDDGPNGDNDTTEEVLDMLQKYKIKANFCVIGKNVEKHPDLVLRIYNEGHTIVNHSYGHPFPLFVSEQRILEDFDKADQAIGKALNIPNYRSAYYRPPYALSSSAVQSLIKERNVKIVSLSFLDFFYVDSEYHKENSHKLIKHIKKMILKDKGGVILLHDGIFRSKKIKPKDFTKSNSSINRSWIPDALEEIILHFSDQGYTFKNIDISQW